MFPAWPKILEFFALSSDWKITMQLKITMRLLTSLIYYTANMVHWPMPFDSNRPIVNAGL